MPQPDPSAPDKFNQAVDARVHAVLSDPLGLPDTFVSWMTQTIQAYTMTQPAPYTNKDK